MLETFVMGRQPASSITAALRRSCGVHWKPASQRTCFCADKSRRAFEPELETPFMLGRRARGLSSLGAAVW